MERFLPYIFAVFLVLLGLFLGTELLLALENGVLSRTATCLQPSVTHSQRFIGPPY